MDKTRGNIKLENNYISTENASYSYKSHDEGALPVDAVTRVSIEVRRGSFVVLLGRNGSGKSTFARLMNALLIPIGGMVFVNGIDTNNEEMLWEIRRSTGMVFQNPDNQIVGTVVDEDVAFGPENLGVEPKEIEKRVSGSLRLVGMEAYKKHAPHYLSGGQKQRVAIAGILAMKPSCIILDEATAMLDPSGRKEVMNVLRKLNQEEGITIIHITHHMDEALFAERILVMDKGRILLDGSPQEVFSNVERIKNLGLDVPQVTELFHELRKSGFKLPANVLSIDEAVDAILSISYQSICANPNKE